MIILLYRILRLAGFFCGFRCGLYRQLIFDPLLRALIPLVDIARLCLWHGIAYYPTWGIPPYNFLTSWRHRRIRHLDPTGGAVSLGFGY
jgi:hypothetical protein